MVSGGSRRSNEALWQEMEEAGVKKADLAARGAHKTTDVGYCLGSRETSEESA